MKIVPNHWEFNLGLAGQPPVSPPPGLPGPIGTDQGELARPYLCTNSSTRPLVIIVNAEDEECGTCNRLQLIEHRIDWEQGSWGL